MDWINTEQKRQKKWPFVFIGIGILFWFSRSLSALSLVVKFGNVLVRSYIELYATEKCILFKSFILYLVQTGGRLIFNINDEKISSNLINLETLIISLSYD